MSRLWHWSRRCSRIFTRPNSSLASQLNSVTDADALHFSKILSSPSSVLSTLPSISTSPEELDIYNNDWMGKYCGKSTTVLKPKTTEEVSKIVKWCNDKRIGIVPQGGNTGLVGGGVPLRDEVILSLSNMTQVRSFDPISGILVTDAGCILQTLTGYDLKQLFIGAEGTLGIITGVSILTPPAPQASNNVILALPRFENVLPLYKTVKRQLSEILSAFEFIDRTAYDLAVKHGQGRALSEEEVEGAECFVLVETSGGRREHDEEKLNDLLESLLEAEEPLINTGVLAQNPAQFSSLWALREGVTEAVSKEGKAYKYDISVPLSTFKECVDLTRERLRSKGLLNDDQVKAVIGYGHVGDGNLHLNVIAKAYTPEIQDALEPFVYELVGKYFPYMNSIYPSPRLNNSTYSLLSRYQTASHRGSVSAEHGIGAMKTHALHYSKDETSIAWMKKIKAIFDPNGIMNPGKVLE
ncbi:hypothetical protein HHX47_DHR1001654 [Lentinula edodes]|nr:hypothetical protein HHX47_DHR1001654 [Lentinula edodes]